MNKRLQLAMMATATMSRMFEDNIPFNTYEPIAVPQQFIKFSSKSAPLFREPHRELKEFSIKGRKVMAYSRKDAITRLKHMKKRK